MIGHFTIETQSTKPAIGQVEVHLLAQPPLRADAEAVADDQHANQQLRINRLGRTLGLMSQIFHRDGVFLDSARTSHIATAFLEQQAAVWARPECNTDTGSTNPACILPPLNATLQPTVFAGSVTAFETWFASHTGLDLLL